jgi:hypothetical protein
MVLLSPSWNMESRILPADWRRTLFGTFKKFQSRILEPQLSYFGSPHGEGWFQMMVSCVTRWRSFIMRENTLLFGIKIF